MPTAARPALSSSSSFQAQRSQKNESILAGGGFFEGCVGDDRDSLSSRRAITKNDTTVAICPQFQKVELSHFMKRDRLESQLDDSQILFNIALRFNLLEEDNKSLAGN